MILISRAFSKSILNDEFLFSGARKLNVEGERERETERYMYSHFAKLQSRTHLSFISSCAIAVCVGE